MSRAPATAIPSPSSLSSAAFRTASSVSPIRSASSDSFSTRTAKASMPLSGELLKLTSCAALASEPSNAQTKT